MKIITRILIIALVTGLLFQSNSLLAKGKWKEFTKVVEKEHPIGQDGELDIESKHGNINVSTWDKETVMVKAVITVESKSEDEANEQFEFINVEFMEGTDYLKCATRNSSHENYSWKDYLPWNISSYKPLEYKIEYTVQMPHGADLKIENKHGNIGLTALGGSAVIEQKYGNLSAETVNGDMKLYLSHGNGYVDSANDFKGELRYSNFTLNKAENINLDSKHSKVEIKEAKTLRLESRYDDFELGKVDELTGDCKYSDYDIEEIDRITIDASYSDFTMQHLHESVNAELRFGEFIIRDLEDDFKEVTINGSHSDVDIDIDESMEYSLDLEGEHLTIPEKLFKLKQGVFINTNELVIKTKEKVKNMPRIKAKMQHGSFKVE